MRTNQTDQKREIPSPGSKEAIAQGCCCPVLDNAHGKGIMWNGKPAFWITEDCPLHGIEGNGR